MNDLFKRFNLMVKIKEFSNEAIFALYRVNQNFNVKFMINFPTSFSYLMLLVNIQTDI